MLNVLRMLQAKDSLDSAIGSLPQAKVRLSLASLRPLHSIMHHAVTTYQLYYWTLAAAIGSWSSSGKGITAVSAHVCALMAGQCHKPANRSCGGCYPATNAEQRSKVRGRKHAW